MAMETGSFSDLRRLAVEICRSEFQELSDSWRNLDTKAEGLGAIAGIFLAAVFTWATEIPTSFGTFERLTLVGAIFLLIIAVVAAVLALRIREIAVARFKQTAKSINDILRDSTEDELGELIDDFYNDQIKVWEKTNDHMREGLPSKAAYKPPPSASRPRLRTSKA